MKEKNKKKYSAIKYIICSLLVIGCIAIGIYSHFGGFGTGACADTEEFAKYAASVDDITIPEHTQIVALGEATHGNAEFQQLRLDVFQVMVEKYDIRAFALEGDYGGCEVVNRYIHGGSGTAEEAASAIGFAIYRTEEMADLFLWMRTYNETAEPGQDICFYGFDMQRQEYNYQFLLEAAKNSDVNTDELEKIWDMDKKEYSEDYSLQQRTEIITSVKNELIQKDEQQNAHAIHFADILLQNIELGKHMEDASLIGVRDELMAQNVEWILTQEEARGNSRIFISGHNGHVKRYGSYYGTEYKYMGNLLADKYEDNYFVIGTDFYQAKCNLPKGQNRKRITHTFYSYDPLAKAAKKCGYDISYLDFSIIPEDSELKSQITEYTYMGSLGESYTPLYLVLPAAYREWASPSESYDSMIYVTNAHPTIIRDEVTP